MEVKAVTRTRWLLSSGPPTPPPCSRDRADGQLCERAAVWCPRPCSSLPRSLKKIILARDGFNRSTKGRAWDVTHDRVVLIWILPLQSQPLSVLKGCGCLLPYLRGNSRGGQFQPHTQRSETPREELSHAPRENFGRNIFGCLFPPERENEESFYFPTKKKQRQQQQQCSDIQSRSLNSRSVLAA